MQGGTVFTNELFVLSIGVVPYPYQNGSEKVKGRMHTTRNWLNAAAANEPPQPQQTQSRQIDHMFDLYGDIDSRQGRGQKRGRAKR